VIEMGVAESMFGLAFGDAMGAPTEFKQLHEIKRLYGKQGIRDVPASGHVTDDTQMGLEVGEALIEAIMIDPAGALTYEAFEPVITRRFMAWHEYTDSTRAPGGACLRACDRMLRGLPWWEATDVNSKGCGANMRVTPVGLVAGLTDEERAGVAQFQSAVTHAHPTALAAADATQWAVHLLLTGTRPEDLVEELLEYAEDQMGVYHEEWLGKLYTWADARTGLDYIQRGWSEVQGALLNVMNATFRPSRKIDPCLLTGDGWVAEEALATALHCFLLYPEDGVMAIRRAANTRGDSDSLAAITGALAGAHLGPGAFPETWHDRIEYRGRIARLVEDLV
jgi:ADP-ribosylglycohydrolase